MTHNSIVVTLGMVTFKIDILILGLSGGLRDVHFTVLLHNLHICHIYFENIK